MQPGLLAHFRDSCRTRNNSFSRNGTKFFEETIQVSAVYRIIPVSPYFLLKSHGNKSVWCPKYSKAQGVKARSESQLLVRFSVTCEASVNILLHFPGISKC